MDLTKEANSHRVFLQKQQRNIFTFSVALITQNKDIKQNARVKPTVDS